MNKNTSRRNIWETPHAEAAPAQAIQDWAGSPAVQTEAPAPPPAVPVVDQLRLAEKQPRDRSWEQANRPVLYRGVPPELHQSVNQVAKDLQVRTGDVARAFLEYGLLCHRRGELKIEPVFCNQRLTLFPENGNGWGGGHPGWQERSQPRQANPAPVRKGKAAKDTPPKAWRQQVAYRGIPEDVQEAVRELHRSRHVPLGEVVTLLLGYALLAYRDGRLALLPQPRQSTGLDFSSEV